MRYILIVFLLHSWGGGAATATFANQESCVSAGESMYSGGQSLEQKPNKRFYVCAPYNVSAGPGA